MVTIHHEGDLPASSPTLLQNLVRYVAQSLDCHGDVALVFAAKEKSAELNQNYRGKSGPTNVLSFPSEEKGVLGDIIVTSALVKIEAETAGISIVEHEQRLIVHGLLHLMGYLHDNEEEAAAMEKREYDLYTAFCEQQNN